MDEALTLLSVLERDLFQRASRNVKHVCTFLFLLTGAVAAWLVRDAPVNMPGISIRAQAAGFGDVFPGSGAFSELKTPPRVL